MISGHVGPEEKLPHRTLHMDEHQRRLERYTFVETLPNDDDGKAI